VKTGLYIDGRESLRPNYLSMIACGLAAAVLLATAVLAEDGKAAFEKRRDAMKEIGRAFYVGVGRVVKGRTEYGPDTVVAAETVARLAQNVGTLFPPGSNVEDSKMKPAILAVPDKVTQLVAALQAATPGFVADVKSGDKERIATGYATMSKACDACHDDYRAD
jgi:cytochrome c556